jgi:hypothetical protein
MHSREAKMVDLVEEHLQTKEKKCMKIKEEGRSGEQKRKGTGDLLFSHILTIAYMRKCHYFLDIYVGYSCF